MIRFGSVSRGKFSFLRSAPRRNAVGDKSFAQAFSKACGFQRQSLWSRPAGREILCFHKDQEGRRNSPVGCCVVGNPIKGFPDAAYHAAFVQPAICQPVFRHAGTPQHKAAAPFALRGSKIYNVPLAASPPLFVILNSGVYARNLCRLHAADQQEAEHD